MTPDDFDFPSTSSRLTDADFEPHDAEAAGDPTATDPTETEPSERAYPERPAQEIERPAPEMTSPQRTSRPADGRSADEDVAADSEPTDSASLSDEQAAAFGSLQQPFVGRWNQLVSTTNWEKGRIISQWRQALMDADAPATEFSDEAWAARVGGVTAPHVGRLRRVFDRFGDQYQDYPKLYWSHFLAAMDWDDAPLWLQGAVESSWSVAAMREQRWKANGGLDSDRPMSGQVVDVDLDEDTPAWGTQPAQGGGSSRDFDADVDGVAAGPHPEGPDFGEEDTLASGAAAGANASTSPADERDDESPAVPFQPFAGLPALPDDLSDVIEQLKLAILRHKSDGFRDVSAQTIRRYLEAVGKLTDSAG